MGQNDREGMDRRGALECRAGSGVLWTMARRRAAVMVASGPLGSRRAGGSRRHIPADFRQSRTGFKGPANRDPLATLEEAIAKIDTLPRKPAFMIHTGDVSHVSKPEQFGNADKDGREGLGMANAGLRAGSQPRQAFRPVHQIMQKIEGALTSHTAYSAAFAQPVPGTAPTPRPMRGRDGSLRSMLGIASVTVNQGTRAPAVTDSQLDEAIP